jgi:hypothetical protein
MTENAVELLSEDERVDLGEVSRGLEARVATEARYVEGRVAGLCSAGSLDLASEMAGTTGGESMSADR